MVGGAPPSVCAGEGAWPPDSPSTTPGERTAHHGLRGAVLGLCLLAAGAIAAAAYSARASPPLSDDMHISIPDPMCVISHV